MIDLLKIFAMASMLIAISCSTVPTKELETAQSLRDRAVRYERVTKLAETPFSAAETDFSAANELIAAEEELKEAKAMLLKAIENYQMTLDEGMPAYSAELQKEIDEIFARAEQIRVKISAEERFNTIASEYEVAKADTNYDVSLGSLEQIRDNIKQLTDEIEQLLAASEAEIKIIREKTQRLEFLVNELEKNTSGSKNKKK